jgi:hypothetical protein
LGLLFPTYGKITNVPNHQPVYMCFAFLRKFLPGKCRKVPFFFIFSSEWKGQQIPLSSGPWRKNMSNHQPVFTYHRRCPYNAPVMSTK